MKLQFETVIITIVAVIFFGFIVTSTTPVKKEMAYVDTMQGINIFLVTTPVQDHKFLGTVTMPKIVWNGKLNEMVNTAVKRAKKQYPGCTGVLIKDYKFSTVEAISYPQ